MSIKKIEKVNLDFVPKILVVEDYQPNQILIRKLLEKMGCNVEIAEHGEEALDMLANRQYGLIFMDCKMPYMDGFETTTKIKEIYPKCNVAVIAVTASAMQEDIDRCFACGMKDYLSKPIRADKLKKVIEKYCLAQ